MKLIIAGSRSFNNYELLKDYLTRVKLNISIIEIISGCARGADRLGERYAKEHNIKLIRFPAQWNIHGKSAGYLRNKEMLKYADHVIVFWDGNSPGTKHMINEAEKANKLLTVIMYKE